MGTGYFLEVKSGWGMTLTPHPLLVPWPRKSSYTSTPPMGRMARTGPQCLYTGPLHLETEERVNLRELNELEVRKEYQIKI
jgi:hypothetical protein